MDSDKQSAKNGKGAPKRRISALQKVAGSLPAGSDVESSLDDFIASANQTLTDTDAFKLASDITGETKKKEEAAAATLEAHSAAEVARVAAEEAARKVLAEVTRKSAQHMAQLEAKLAEAEARASSAEMRVRAPRAPSPLPLVVEEGADFAEGSFSQHFGYGGDMFRSRRHGALKAILIIGGAAVVAAGVFLGGNGRLWNKDEAPAKAAAPAVVAQADRPAAQPAPVVTPAPAVSALPEPVEEKAAAKVEKPAPAMAREPQAAAPAVNREPQAAAPAPTVPVVSSLAPTVEPLDGDAAPADKPAKKNKKAKASRKPTKKVASGKSSGSKKASGGIVDPFAQ